MTDDIAILHDQWTERGGAERVAVELARTFDAPIYAGRVDDELVPADVKVVSPFDRWWVKRGLRGPYIVQDGVQMLAWQHVDDLHDYDALIVNKNNPGWYVPKDDQVVIKYGHTTPRGPYDLFHEHGDHMLTRAIKTVQRGLYQQTLPYPDRWVCNSELVARRHERYLDQPADDVIYPPVPVEDFSADARETGDYYFTISRLYGHKHVEAMVRAFRELHRDGNTDYRLIVAGEGPQRDQLEDLATPNVEFRGYVSDEEKRELYAGAKATLFAAENEDFGLVPIESMGAGTPVIGVRDGFTKFQIRDGENGYLFARQGGHLREMVRYFERRGVAWSAQQIAEFAGQFSTQRFRREMRAVVDETVASVEESLEPEFALPPTQPEDPVVADGGDS